LKGDNRLSESGQSRGAVVRRVDVHWLGQRRRRSGFSAWPLNGCYGVEGLYLAALTGAHSRTPWTETPNTLLV